MSNVTALTNVTSLSARRDQLKAQAKPDEELRDKIVRTKFKLGQLRAQLKAEVPGGDAKRAELESSAAALEAQLKELEAQRPGRPSELDAVMGQLRTARIAARTQELADIRATVAKQSDAELEQLSYDIDGQIQRLLLRGNAVAAELSDRAALAANRKLIKNLSVSEILAALTPEQRAELEAAKG